VKSGIPEECKIDQGEGSGLRRKSAEYQRYSQSQSCKRTTNGRGLGSFTVFHISFLIL